MLKIQFQLLIMFLVSQYTISQESSIALLVNNVVQKPRNNLQNIQTIIYNYGENDAVDVSCVCLNRKCDLQMNYDYATMLDDSFKTNYSSYEVGFRFKLQAIHNNSQITCNCIECKESILVIFILRHVFNNILSLKIDGLVVREVRPKPTRRLNILMTEHSFPKNKHIQLTFDMDMDLKLRMKTYPDSQYQRISFLCNTTGHVDLKIPRENFYATFVAENINITKKRKEFQLLFRVEHFPLSDTSQLNVDLPREKVILEFYNYEGQKVVYYEFDDGDRLKLKCQTKSRYSITFISPETKLISPYSIQSEIQLRSSFDGKTLQCLLTDRTEDTKNEGRKWAHAIIKLHRKRITTSAYKQPQDHNMMIFCSLAGMGVVILIIALLYCYWRRRRQGDSSEMSTDNIAVELKSSGPPTLSLSENDGNIYESIAYEERMSYREEPRYINIKQCGVNSNKCETELYTNVF